MRQATTSARSTCSICAKERVTYKCVGCSRGFCFDHLAEHRQAFSKQFGEIENDRAQLHQTLVEQKKASKKSSLIQEVDKWEEDSIQKIKQTAEESRQILIGYQTTHLIQIEKQLSELTEQLKTIREENEFNETDLNRLKSKLTKLVEELSQLPNLSIQQGSTSFIKKISIVVSSGNRQEKKINEIDSNQIQIKLTEELNQLLSTSDLNESASFINKSSMNVSSGKCDDDI
ncbi:unnamed protein product [Rotaria sordida]|uniref:Uncharacterized protein n=1 Tax=Rotaria sordida TaxID=392033 RepID=A0A814JHS2_9BILA|nr:unnamed protein product [Rotaria sordida]CAF3989655.1 unnamed protein product [Rotaria sordida]